MRTLRLLAILVALLALAISTLPATAAQTTIVVNGDFELPAYPPGTPWVTYFAPSPAIVGWLVESGSVDHKRDYWKAASGKQSIDLTGNGSRGTMLQNLSTTAGAKYRLRFAMAGNPETGFAPCRSESQVKRLEIRWGSTVVAILSHSVTGHTFANMGWTYHEFVVTADGSVTPLRFRDVTTGGSTVFCGATLDDVSVTALPATLTLAPVTATNPVDTEHCVTATVKDLAGNAVPNVTVRFEVTGSVNTSGAATTNTNGEATFCYTGPPLPGADAISAFADTDNDGTQDVGEPSNTATKTWVLPATTPGCDITITNGGWFVANNGDRGQFSGNAQSSATGETQGQESYRDMGPNADLAMRSTNVLAIVCEGTTPPQASIHGQATINGSGSFDYRIKVKDVANPGADQDTYWILLSNGYDSGEHTLEAGNVNITIH